MSLKGLRAQFGEMRNERHPTAASDATHVHKHHLDAYGYGGKSHRAYIGGLRGVLADSKAPFFEYAMRGSPRAHPTLLVSPSTKRTYAVMVDVFTVRISEAPGGQYRLLEVSICEYAKRGSLALHYAQLGSPRTKQASLSTAIVQKQGVFEVPS